MIQVKIFSGPAHTTETDANKWLAENDGKIKFEQAVLQLGVDPGTQLFGATSICALAIIHHEISADALPG